MLKRGDKVYTQIVKNCSIAQLLPIIEERATKDSAIFTDGLNWYSVFPHWAGKVYDGLVDYGYKQQGRALDPNKPAFGGLAT